MAVVRLTEDLKNAIKRRGEALFDEDITAAEKLKPTDMGDYVYETLFADHKELLMSLPKGLCQYTNALTVQAISYDRNIHIRMEVSLPWSVLPYSSVIELNHGEIVSSYQFGVALDADPVWDELRDRYNAYKAELNDVLDRKKAFMDTLTALLNAHTTLSPALKAWPMLWSLVPDEAKERHKKIVERPKKVVEEAEQINTDQLSAVVALNRMTK